MTIFTYSPSYFVTPSVPNRVFKMNKKIRILLIVRDPLTRLISDYTQILHNHMEKNLVFKPFRTLAFNPDGSVNLQYDALLRSLYVNFSNSYSISNYCPIFQFYLFFNFCPFSIYFHFPIFVHFSIFVQFSILSNFCSLTILSRAID